MGCCGKTVEKVKHIATGFAKLALDIDRDMALKRIRICKDCDKIHWLGRTLWCSICKCFIPAKARVKNEKCPKGRW